MTQNEMFCIERLKRITEIIDRVEQRCIAADGPITNTRLEMTDSELRSIYHLAAGSYRKKKKEARRERE